MSPIKDDNYPALVSSDEDCEDTEWHKADGSYSNAKFGSSNDIIEHLPDCTGFDWVPPKPVEAPDGWRLLTKGERIVREDRWWDGKEWKDLLDGRSIVGEQWEDRTHHPVARKIEPPQPKYRPFKDRAEFKPFRDKWVKYKQSDVGKTMLCVSFSNEGVTAGVSFMPYKTAFDSLVFEDGSPFGVLEDE
jgi:hypothetical protein